MAKQRLDKFVSNQLNLSRSVVRTSIRRGKATVDGVTVHDCSTIIDTDISRVVYEGNRVEYKQYVYFVINKPAGVISATDDKRQKTVIDLIPENLRRPSLSPVGRLDKDTTGLLIITDDGAFAHDCISPKKDVEKCYVVQLDGVVTENMVEEFSRGITLADGTVCRSAKLVPLTENTVKVIITEGKYHQIKRMFGVVGLGVNKLHRESIGGLQLPAELGPGDWKEFTKKELLMMLEKQFV